ncbi:MAG: DUF3566 domain-containing protein [Nitriliruptoraceae bacterium]
MARRRLTIKRIDPWSMLKFGAFLSLVLYLVFLVVAGVVWFVIDRLQLVDQACELALDVGFTSCAVNAVNLFQVLALLGAMWVIVQTAVLVFLSFLHNLIADLTGGLVVGIVDDTGPPTAATSGPVVAASAGRSDRGGTHAKRSPSVDQDTRAVPAATPSVAREPVTERPAAEPSRPKLDDDPLFGDER